MVASIDSPDLETRIAIVNHKAELQGVELSQDVAIHIAEAHATNVRELEGALTRVTALAKLTHRPITTDLVSQMLPSLKAQSKEIQLTEVVESCSAHYGITRVEIIGSSRKKEIANARHVSMYLAKTMTSASLKRIGVEFGGRDHSTVIHACKKVEVLIQSHPEFASEIERLRHRVATSSTRAA